MHSSSFLTLLTFRGAALGETLAFVCLPFAMTLFVLTNSGLPATPVQPLAFKARGHSGVTAGTRGTEEQEQEQE